MVWTSVNSQHAPNWKSIVAHHECATCMDRAVCFVNCQFQQDTSIPIFYKFYIDNNLIAEMSYDYICDHQDTVGSFHTL